MATIYDLTAEVCDRAGRPMINDDGAATTMRDSIVRALDLINDTAQPAGKTERFSIATRIYESGGKVELMDTEIETIKIVLAKAFPPLVFARIVQALDEQRKAA